MLIEQYPVGWAIGSGKPEPVLAFLMDVPGIAMQGKSWAEAVAKLQAFAPAALAVLRREGKLPRPSAEPAFKVARVKWTTPSRAKGSSIALRETEQATGELALT